MQRKLIFAVVMMISLLPGMVTAASAGQAEIRFAITSAVASDPSYAAYRELTSYLAGKVGRKPVFISGLSYGQVDNLFLSGRADVGFLCNTHFASRKDAVKFEAVAAPVIMGYGRPKFQIYYIVHKDSHIQSIDDLKGKTVDLADPLSTTSVYAAYMLQKKNETLNSFFGKVIYSGSHDMTVELVANKMVDAGIIDGHIWDFHDRVQPAFSSKTKIIYRSQDFTVPPVVVARTIDEALKRNIKKVLLTMHEDGGGKRILTRLRIEKFVDIKDRDYKDVFQMYSKVKSRI